MIKFFKKTCLLTILTLALFINATCVNAASGYSFSVGTKFSSTSGDDSTDEATIANSKLSGMGYTTKLLTIPTFSTLTSSINSSRDWLESDVLYFLGHANTTTIYWDYMGYGGDYAMAIKNISGGYCDDYWTYTGLGLYDMSYVDLGVFMGCSTASNSSSNLPKYAYNQGAKVTLGWTVDIPQADTYNWTNRFFTRLSNGYSVSNAVSYANSFTYSSTAIKNVKTYGSTGTTINSVSLPAFEVADTIVDSYTFNEKITPTEVSEDKKIETVESLIKNNINSNFNLDDYVVEMATNDYVNIYDYYYTINGIKTNAGYTVFTDLNNNKIINIVDNMNNIDTLSLSRVNNNAITAKETLITENRLNDMRDKAVEITGEIKYNTPNKTIIDEYKYYDVFENKLYYYIVVEVVDPIPNTKAIEYYIEEI